MIPLKLKIEQNLRVEKEKMSDADRNNMKQILKMKFRSLNYTNQKRQQKTRDVTEEGKQKQAENSFNAWKRLNPGYIEDPFQTTNQVTETMREKTFESMQEVSSASETNTQSMLNMW